MILHLFHQLIQSHTTYDALAQDIIIQSNQGGVYVRDIFYTKMFAFFTSKILRLHTP